MKHKHNAGFSLVEVLVAIVLLGILVVPICSSLVLTFRMNEKTDKMLQAQLAVSSAAETLLAEGIDERKLNVTGPFDDYLTYKDERFPEVKIEVYIKAESDAKSELAASYDVFKVMLTSRTDESVVVQTSIREMTKEEVAAS